MSWIHTSYPQQLRFGQGAAKRLRPLLKEAGGTCLADLTLPGIGRDPAWLRRIARRTGLHLVMGTGWYRQPYYPPDALIDRRSVAERGSRPASSAWRADTAAAAEVSSAALRSVT